MPGIKHPYRVQIAIIGAYGAIAIGVSAMVWRLLGKNAGQLALVMGAPFMLLLLAIPWLAILGRRHREVARSLLAGQGLLAHWTYAPAEWRRYAASELRLIGCKCAVLLLLIYVILFAFVLLLSVVTEGQADPIAVQGALVVASLLALPVVAGWFIAGLSRYVYNVTHPGDVYVGQTGVYMSGRWYAWGGKQLALRRMRFIHEPPRQLHFTIFYFWTRRDPGLWYTVRVPIPEGEEERANEIYGLLTAGAHPAGIARRFLVERLQTMGFFDFVEPAMLADVLQRTESGGVRFWPALKRSIRITSDLSAGGVLAELERFGQVLQRLGLPASDYRCQLYPYGLLTVQHQGDEWLILLPFEPQEPGAWHVANQRVAEVANLLLCRCSGGNRAYPMQTKDHGLVLVLTPDMYRTLWPEQEQEAPAELPEAQAEADAEAETEGEEEDEEAVESVRLLLLKQGLTSEAFGELGNRLLAQGLQFATERVGEADPSTTYLMMYVTGPVGMGLEETVVRVATQVALPEGSFLLAVDTALDGLVRVVGLRAAH